MYQTSEEDFSNLSVNDCLERLMSLVLSCTQSGDQSDPLQQRAAEVVSQVRDHLSELDASESKRKIEELKVKEAVELSSAASAKVKPKPNESTKGSSPAKTSASLQSPHLFQAARKQPPAATAFERVKAHSKEIKQQYRITDQEVKNVLDAVVRGRLEEVEAALKANKEKNNGYCALLHVQADTTEAEQKFYEMLPHVNGGSRQGGSPLMLTPFQFAARESDIEMCDLILRYFYKQNENRLAAEQMNALKEDKELIRTYGSPFFDLQATNQAYKTLQAKWDSWSWDQREKQWCEVIGKHQQSWPAWLRYDITQPGYNAPWCKKTVNARPQKRELSAKSIKPEYIIKSNYIVFTMRGVVVDKYWGRGCSSTSICGRGWVEDDPAAPLRWRRLIHQLEKRNIHHDWSCLRDEQAAVAAYRDTLLTKFAPLLHTTSESASIAQR